MTGQLLVGQPSSWKDPPTKSLLEIQSEQKQESDEAHDSHLRDELTNEQFELIQKALQEEGLESTATDKVDVDVIEALLPMRIVKANVDLSIKEPRAFFRTIDKESIVIFERTGTALDEVVKLIVRDINLWISSFGIAELNERREISAYKRGASKPANLAPGKVSLYFRDAPAGAPRPADVIQDLENISKDLYLWLGREESRAKLGENSLLMKSLWKSWTVHKIISFLIQGKKERSFEVVKTALSGLRGAGWVSKKNFVSNLRVVFGLINKYFFDVFANKSYAAMQNSPYKLTASKINGELKFKSHNIEVLQRVLTSDEKLILAPWLTSPEAKRLKELTKQVFSEHKFRELPKLAEASNAWDKLVSKAVIKILYRRNKERSTLQAHEREAAQTRNRQQGSRASAVAARQVDYSDVKRSFIQKKDFMPICTPLLEVCYKVRELDYERALSFGSRAFEFDPSDDSWLIGLEDFDEDEPLFRAYPNLRTIVQRMIGTEEASEETVPPPATEPRRNESQRDGIKDTRLPKAGSQARDSGKGAQSSRMASRGGAHGGRGRG